jgi:hypothetical protein
MPLSLWRQRPWQHKRFKQALAILVFVVPNLLLTFAMVPASQASRASAQDQRLASFTKRHTQHAQKSWSVSLVIPITQPTVIPTTIIPTVVAPTVVTPTVVAPSTAVVPAPETPAPAPTPAPVVDTSSAAAWAASPGVACIRQHESGDNYSTDTGNGYYGAYQDSLSTWQSHGGTGLPNDAPPAVQDQINYDIWLTGGWGQWSTAAGCGL